MPDFVPQTPNLRLWLPTPGVYASLPLWGQLWNENAQALDQLGASVTPARMNIDADLPFNGYSATGFGSLRFNPRTGTFDSDVLSALYFVGNDFYVNNGAGVPVQITNGSSLAGAAGTITGMHDGAACAYSDANGFTFVGVGGNKYSPLVAGPLTIYDTAAGPPSYGITLKSPVSMAAFYDLTLPAAVPASTLPLFMSSSGAMTTGRVTRAQMTAPVKATLSLGSGWSGTVEWWVDAVSMVHLQGSASTSGVTADIASIPVGPQTAPGVSLLFLAIDTNDGVASVVTVTPSGVLRMPAAVTGHSYEFNLVAYLGVA